MNVHSDSMIDFCPNFLTCIFAPLRNISCHRITKCPGLSAHPGACSEQKSSRADRLPLLRRSHSRRRHQNVPQRSRQPADSRRRCRRRPEAMLRDASRQHRPRQGLDPGCKCPTPILHDADDDGAMEGHVKGHGDEERRTLKGVVVAGGLLSSNNNGRCLASSVMWHDRVLFACAILATPDCLGRGQELVIRIAGKSLVPGVPVWTAAVVSWPFCLPVDCLRSLGHVVFLLVC